MIVVIPAYQPDEKLCALVERLREETEYRIVIVNDGSSEERKPIFDRLEQLAVVLHHAVNRGKGAAMKTAFDFIAKSDELHGEAGVVTVDADGQHLIKDIVRVSDEFLKNRDALVLGSRAFKGSVPLRSRLGNGITRFVFAVSTGVRVYDTQTGLRAFSTELLDEMLAIKGDRYEYEINQLLTCTKKRIRIIEVGIETVYLNDNESSHFNVLRDSWRIYKSIFAFVGTSLLSWLIDYTLLLVLTPIFASISGGSGFSVFGLALQPEAPAICIARLVSSIVNYFLNRKLVFESKAKGSLVRYYLLAAVMLAVNYLLLLLLKGAGIPIAVGQIIAQIIIYPLNYFIQRRFVF